VTFILENGLEDEPILNAMSLVLSVQPLEASSLISFTEAKFRYRTEPEMGFKWERDGLLRP